MPGSPWSRRLPIDPPAGPRRPTTGSCSIVPRTSKSGTPRPLLTGFTHRRLRRYTALLAASQHLATAIAAWVRCCQAQARPAREAGGLPPCTPPAALAQAPTDAASAVSRVREHKPSLVGTMTGVARRHRIAIELRRSARCRSLPRRPQWRAALCGAVLQLLGGRWSGVIRPRLVHSRASLQVSAPSRTASRRQRTQGRTEAAGRPSRRTPAAMGGRSPAGHVCIRLRPPSSAWRRPPYPLRLRWRGYAKVSVRGNDKGLRKGLRHGCGRRRTAPRRSHASVYYSVASSSPAVADPEKGGSWLG